MSRELTVPDLDVAVLQLFALTLYPHLVSSAFGSRIDAELTEQPIVTGIDMFLEHYRALSS